jgi:hypothetical protein
MIARRVDSLPHTLVDNIPEHLGKDGEVLARYARWLRERIPQLAGEGYQPTIHLDVHGALGGIYENELGKILGYLYRLEAAVSPYPLRVESPVIMDTRDAQIDAMQILREYVRLRKMKVGLVADEWANTLDDIQAFIAAQAVDMIQIKMPDLGSVHNSIEAVLTCKAEGIGAGSSAHCPGHPAQYDHGQTGYGRRRGRHAGTQRDGAYPGLDQGQEQGDPLMKEPFHPLALPHLKMFDQAQCEQIHLASLEVLRRTGVRVHQDEALDLLKGAGAHVSDDNLVKIPASLVEWALKQAPSRIGLCARGTDQVVVPLEGRQVSFGSGSDCPNYLDPRSGASRRFTNQDVIDCIRVVDALPELSFVMSMGIPSDLETANTYRQQFALMNTPPSRWCLCVTTEPTARPSRLWLLLPPVARTNCGSALPCFSTLNRPRLCNTRTLPPRSCSTWPNRASPSSTRRHP